MQESVIIKKKKSMKKTMLLAITLILLSACGNKKDKVEQEEQEQVEYVYRCRKMIHRTYDCEKLRNYVVRNRINPSEIEEVKTTDLKKRYLFCEECYSDYHFDDYERVFNQIEKNIENEYMDNSYHYHTETETETPCLYCFNSKPKHSNNN